MSASHLHQLALTAFIRAYLAKIVILVNRQRHFIIGIHQYLNAFQRTSSGIFCPNRATSFLPIT
tara:strand:+ start:12780 stop:12971 length:192 start_codon:yes stop_codon:yes gene_type:complete